MLAERRDQRRREAREQAYRRLRERYDIVMEAESPSGARDANATALSAQPQTPGQDETIAAALGVEADRVEYDGGATFPDPNGASMSLIDPALDNNVGANWCEASTPFGDGDLGTPGGANDCVTAPVVVINEIMNNPSAVSDSNGEWFEIFNPTAAAIDIDGWTIRDNGSDSFVIDNGGPLLVPAGG